MRPGSLGLGEGVKVGRQLGTGRRHLEAGMKQERLGSG